MKVIIGLTAFFGACALTGMISEFLANHAPDWLWLPIFMVVPVCVVVWLGREYRASVRRERRRKAGRR